MHTALIGASKGIGRSTALQLLQDDPSNTISLLLRTPTSIQADDEFQPFIKVGRIRIIKGDAYDANSIRQLVDIEDIDSIVSTLGAVYPNGKRQFSWGKGFLLPSLDVCTRATLTLVQVLGQLVKEGKKPPSLVIISLTGVGKSAQYLPIAYKMILPWLLQQTIDDKRGVETILSKVSTSLPAETDNPTSSAVLDTTKLQDLQPFLNQVLIVRPAQLKDTNGKQALRAGEDVSTYSTGRVELGRWIAGALSEREIWMNRRVTVGF